MALAAAQIIDALAARITGLSLAGADVFTSRAWPLVEADLPAWRVVAMDEQIDSLTVHAPTVQAHELQVELQGYASAVADLDDTLHALAAEALDAVFSTPGSPDALSALLPKLAITLRRIERAMRAEGQATLGLVSLTLRVAFRTKADAPEAIL